MQPRIGGDISARVAEGEGLFGARHAAQHRIGETARARRHRLHQLDALIDGGMGDNVPTTVVDLTGDEPEVLREGKGELQ